MTTLQENDFKKSTIKYHMISTVNIISIKQLISTIKRNVKIWRFPKISTYQISRKKITSILISEIYEAILCEATK